MRPEITHYRLKITAELADILGITLDEGKSPGHNEYGSQ
jgi:hypothetical protein